MANNRVGSNAGTFAKLVPKSRFTRTPLNTQAPNRKVPDHYRTPTSTAHQTSVSSGPTDPGNLRDEMRAVQSIYTARIGDEGLPSSAQELYRLVADMAAKTVSGSDEHPSVSIEAVNTVRCIDRYIRETTSELNTVRQDLWNQVEDNSLFRFHAQYGDYAAYLCNILKEFRESSIIQSQPWTIVVGAIDKEEAALDAWTASNQSSPRPDCLYLEALKSLVDQLVRDGETSLDMDLALAAIRFYARRNYICHGRLFDLFKSENFAGLANYIDLDDKRLEELLPDEEKPQVDKYRRMINFYKDSHIRQNGSGRWERKPPRSAAAGLLNPSVRPWGPELRSRIEMGLCRPAGSSGPPPANVSFSTAAFRRSSDPEQGGSKRPAVEQPSGAPCDKKAAWGLNYPHVRPATKGPVADGDANGVAKLQADLHALHAELAYRSPEKSKMIIQEEIQRLEKELEKVGAAIRKKFDKKAGKGRSTR